MSSLGITTGATVEAHLSDGPLRGRQVGTVAQVDRTCALVFFQIGETGIRRTEPTCLRLDQLSVVDTA